VSHGDFLPEGTERLRECVCARVCEVLGGAFSDFLAAHPCVSVRSARVPKLSSYMIPQCSWMISIIIIIIIIIIIKLLLVPGGI